MGKLKTILKKKDDKSASDLIKKKLNTVKFKATLKHKENESTFTKLNEPVKHDTKEHENQLNLIKTNLLKNIDEKLVKKVDKKAKIKTDADKKVEFKPIKTIKKKDKMKQKKAQWLEKINLIKTQVKENKEKAKREKTVITGDFKSLQDALEEPEKAVRVKKQRPVGKPKAVQKESVRSKQAKDDITLFNQLIDYPKFTDNPLEILKKHFDSKNK